jgi:hypothetical protein
LPAVARPPNQACGGWSGRRGSNPRPTAWKAVTLPLSYSRLRGSPPDASSPLRRGKPACLRPLLLSCSGEQAANQCVSPTCTHRRYRRPCGHLLVKSSSPLRRSVSLAGLPSRSSLPRASEGWWRGEDSNLRRPGPTDLQSAAFDRFATSPRCCLHVSAPMQTSTADGWKRGVFVRNCAARELSGEFVGAGEGI